MSAMEHSAQMGDGAVVGPAVPTNGIDGLPEHLHVIAVGNGDFYLLCERHGMASLLDSYDATLRAECPGCAAQRELAWIELRNHLRLS